MNNELFQQARAAYTQGNYEAALDAYTECLQDVSDQFAPGEIGQIYHQIGNCLIKLKNPTEAIEAYTQATADAAYDACGAVNYNLGMAYASLHDYEDAVRHFEIAVSDRRYATPYKAYSAMGNALMKIGKSAEAGVAFREAALDESNPDPTKALLNLGVCFMALDRPQDAVASYESALQFDMQPETSNKMYANLGQAYVACGQMQKAVSAFEASLADKTYFLSDSASVDYQRAIGAVSQGTCEITQALPAVAPSSADMSGLDVIADGTPMYAAVDPYAEQQGAPYYPEAYDPNNPYAIAGNEDRFFNSTEQEIETWAKQLAKQDRKRRNVGLKILVTLILIVVLLVGAGVFLYSQGWGYPSQQQVVEQLFADPTAAPTTVFSKDVNAENAQTMVEPVVQDSSPTIDGMDKSMSNSTVFVTATTPEGGSVQYKVSLVRDVLGWKVASVELYFPSQE